MQAMLVVFALALFSLPSVFGIMCNVCNPNVTTMTLCSIASQLTEVDCANVTKPAQMSSEMEYDACAVTTIISNFNQTPITSFVMSCAVKTNSSDPDKVNCSVTEAHICGEARAYAQNSSLIEVSSCSSECCTTSNCNKREPPETTTAKPATTVESGVPSIHWLHFGFFAISLSMCFMFK